MSKLWYL